MTNKRRASLAGIALVCFALSACCSPKQAKTDTAGVAMAIEYSSPVAVVPDLVTGPMQATTDRE